MIEQRTLDVIIEELKPKQCLRDVAQYWTFRSTVPGPEMRRAGEFLVRRHREHGLEAELRPFPADDRTVFLGMHKNPLAWTPRAARLSVVQPDGELALICDFAQEPLCLVSNSTGAPDGGVEAEVVVMHSGVEDAEYEGVDVKGKIIFTDAPTFHIDAPARKHGAIGILTDCVAPPWLAQHPPVRQPDDEPDLTMWGTFGGQRREPGLWGFMLTPRQGRRLRELIRTSSAPVVLRAEVDATLDEGTCEVVDAVLPGADLAHEEIWVLSHSSEPGALDNASGCCLGVEIARALKTLTESGALPPLRRTIRFLNSTEVEGFLPYIDARCADLGHVVAGLCLDSVGMDSAQSGGDLIFFRSPEANASFVDGLMPYLIQRVKAEPEGRFSDESYTLFPWHAEPFWGNDAFIAHGFFDIPTPELSCWPDRFYHSSYDTVDKLSEGSLARAGAICAAYLYLMATAGPDAARSMAGQAALDWKERTITALDAAARAEDATAETIYALGRHMGYQARDAILQAARLASGDAGLLAALNRVADEAVSFAERESASAAAIAAVVQGRQWSDAPETLPVVDDPRAARVYQSGRWTAPTQNDLPKEVWAALVDSLGEDGVTRVWDWLNGRRTLGEVWARVQYGGAIPFAALAEALEVLHANGRVALVA